jgi:hypothetical protein
MVTQLVGQVTTIVSAGTTPELKFQANPTTGTTTDLSAVLNIASDEAGGLYTIHGTPGTALQRGESGSVPGSVPRGIIVAPGAIEAICDENVTGSISLAIWYWPLDEDAEIVAA